MTAVMITQDRGHDAGAGVVRRASSRWLTAVMFAIRPFGRIRPMLSAEIARPALHMVHLLTFGVLLATGLLLLLPDLRAATVGGYALWLGGIHLWVGVAFVVAPLAILMRSRAPILFVAPSVRSARATWQALHVGTTVVMTVLFAVTGFALWADEFVGAKAAEASRTAHAWLTAAAGVFVAVHLLEAGVTHLLTRVRAAIPDSPRIHTEGG